MRVRLVAISAIALLFLPAIALAAPAGDLQGLSGHLDVAMAKVESGDVAGSQAEYDAFAQDWLGIENGVRQQSLDQYQQIESHMTDVTAAYAVQPSEATRIDSALKSLDASVDQFISQFGSSSAGPATAANPATSVQPSVTVASELQTLQQAQAQITSHDATGAANDVKSFIAGWPEIEGPVAAKDANSYTRIENEMDQAYGLLTSTPPNTTQASAVIDDMQSRLTPFSQQVRYGMFDAAIILLREGFEALLVFAALLTFLKRSGNAARQGWVWAGGGAGLGLSVVIAIIVNLAFARAGGSSRELLEGVTGLVAAAMLIWMMFWLHGKSNVAAWNRYISERSQRALATNSLVSLALIAFLAVLREGAETILFYVGIAPAIDPSQLLLGIAAGAACLAVVAVLMLVVGVRIPIRPFFLVTSALVFFLAFKFAGMGVHSLQVSGQLSAHTAGYLPTSEFFGVFPTWETVIIQLLVVFITGVGLALTSGHDHGPQLARHEAPVAGPTHA